MTTNYRAALLHLLSRISFKLGEFKLSSGGTSDYYIDCRTTTLHAEGGRLTGLAILELLHQQKIRPAAVGGLTLGADPIVSNVATASAWHAQEHHGAPLIHGFLVRKAEKAHGTGRRIEGFFEKDAPVLIVAEQHRSEGNGRHVETEVVDRRRRGLALVVQARGQLDSRRRGKAVVAQKRLLPQSVNVIDTRDLPSLASAWRNATPRDRGI